jgi:AcrR family transcriptional regulator
MAEQRRKTTQFDRLIAGMVQATNRRGYAGANVSSVIAEAGVSRPTFYDYFADRDDCLRAAIEHVQGQLHALTTQALAEKTGQAAWQAALGALVDFAATDPARARFLMGEAMAGGARALDARDRGVAALAEVLGAAVAAGPATAGVADLEPHIVLGSVYRMIAARLRRGEVVSAKLAEELFAWLASYTVRASARRWQVLAPVKSPPPSPHVPDVPIQRMPSGLGGGRPRVAPQEVAENQRLRILYATAKLAETKGYAATTVADITKLARVRGNTFYRQFADKQEAFSAVHELGFQQVMDVTAKAFFSVQGWPLRSWEAGRAFTQLLQANPLVAHVAFVEAYAVGPAAVQRIEDTHTAFMFFLQEGLTMSEESLGRVAMEAIIASVFEVIYLQARAGEDLQIAGMLPYIAHLWLTPFLGVKAADAFIDKQQTKRKPAGKGKRTRKAS